MKKLVLLALAGAALAVPTSPAAAAPTCTPLVGVVGNSVSYCYEWVWERGEHSLLICTDKNLDGTPESCKTYFEVLI